ncbi:hypothetical protein F5X68DRAFT_245858, partial [Plectosphaerella plurivora]
MVYRGPSKGCRRCRARKIKAREQCDALQPACLNCTARGAQCPGYGDVFEKAHRNETAKVKKLYSSQSKANEIIFTTKATVSSHKIASETPRSPPSTSETDALGFFFHHYAQSNDLDATCSIFGILPEMFTKAPMSSPLSHATRALALQVTSLHRVRGGNTSVGGKLYFKAVSQVKEALAAPAKCRSEDLLLATLVLDACSTLSTSFGKGESGDSRAFSHLRGSIALLQYRGSLSYGSDLSWRLLTVTRNRFLQQCWQDADELVGIETIHKMWKVYDDRKPRGIAVEADTLSFRLFWLRHLHRKLSTGSPLRDQEEHHPQIIGLDDTEKLKDMVSQASRLANDCALLQNNLPIRWQPASVSISSLATSIQDVSVYKDDKDVTPIIYSRLSIAITINRQILTELGSISLIGTCLGQIAGLETLGSGIPQRRGLIPDRLLARAQVLIDQICASVPFITGNATTDALRNATVNVPSTLQGFPQEGCGDQTLPETITKHRQQVIASGLYVMHGTLKAVLDIIGSNSLVDVSGTFPRAGQVEWMGGQVHRLGRIL